jgi:hypothetical protein
MKSLLSSNARTFPTPRFDADATIFFFDLGPVLSRVGPMSNPERFRLICERHVRSIAGSDLVLFSDNGFYLVVTSSSGPAAIALVNYVNTSLLMLLFGTESLAADQRITLYHSVDPDELPAKLPELIGATPTKTFGRLDANWDPNAQEEREKAESDSYGLLARDGIYIEQGVELTFFPVHDLRRRAVSALFCAPTFAGAVFGHQAFQQLGQSELPYVDRAILMHTLAFARRLAEAGIVMAVGAPVSFETLAWSKSRQIYQWALRSAHVADQAQIILKIEDIPPGTPADRIAQVVSSLRPFSRHIFVHLPNDHIELGMTGKMGASGLVLSLQRRAALPEVHADSRYLSRMAVAQGAMSCIDHVESDEALAVVRNSGIRFAVGNVFGGETLRGTVAIDDVRDVLGRIESATTAHLTT